MKRNGLIIVGVVAVIVVAALVWFFAIKKDSTTKSTSQSSASMSDMSSNNTPQPATMDLVATNKVSIANFAFAPHAITVKKGTTVTWANNDSTAHTVTESDDQTGPKSGTLNTGDTYSFTYDTIGTFNYVCSFHSSMTGSVTVTE